MNVTENNNNDNGHNNPDIVTVIITATTTKITTIMVILIVQVIPNKNPKEKEASALTHKNLTPGSLARAPRRAEFLRDRFCRPEGLWKWYTEGFSNTWEGERASRKTGFRKGVEVGVCL